MKKKKAKKRGRTVVCSVAHVALPPPLVNETDKGVDVSSTAFAPDDDSALNDRQIVQVFERVDQQTKGQLRFGNVFLLLWNGIQRAPHNFRIAVQAFEMLWHFGLDWLHGFRRQDVSIR